MPYHGCMTPPSGQVQPPRASGREAAAVLGTGVLFPLADELFDAHTIFLLLASTGWAAYVLLRIRRDARFVARLGFTRKNLGAAIRSTTLFSIGAAGVMAAFGWDQGHALWNPNLLLLLALYPIWGLIQQTLIQGFLVRWLAERAAPWSSAPVLAALAGSLFGLVHLPDLPLSGATFLLGSVFTLIYVRTRNLWPLGLWHGWLGACFYLWVLGVDPWAGLP